MGIADTVKQGLFHGLHSITKGAFYNRVYFLQAVLSQLFLLSLVLNNDEHQGFNWDSDSALFKGLNGFFLGVSLPLYKLGEVPLTIVFAVAACFVLSTILMFAFIARSVLKSELERQWLITWLRVMVGIILTFWLPILRVFMAPLDCDYFGRISGGEPAISSKSYTFENDCASDAISRLLFGFGFVLSFCMVTFLGFVQIGHLNDPRSWSAMARPHCLMELYSLVGNMIITVMVVLFRGFPWVVALAFLAHQTTCFLFCLVTQPYYDVRMNQLKTGLFFAATLVGLVFCVLTISGTDPNSGLSTLLTIFAYISIVLGVPAGAFLSHKRFSGLSTEQWESVNLNFIVSKEEEEAEAANGNNNNNRRSHTQALDVDVDGRLADFNLNTLQELGQDGVPAVWKLGHESGTGDSPVLQRTAKNVPKVKEDQLWPWVNDMYIPHMSMSVREWVKALCVETSIRQVYQHKRKVSPEDLEIAELLLKWGIMCNPQSIYLQVQYVTFMLFSEQCRRSNTAKFGELGGDSVRDAVVRRLDEVDQASPGLDVGFAVFKKRQELNNMREQAGQSDFDTNSFDEVKRRQKTAFEQHKRARNAISGVWKGMNAGQGPAYMTNLVEIIWRAEQTAEAAYQYVYEKCSISGDMQNSEILKMYSNFLKEVKGDDATARQLMKEFEDKSESVSRSFSRDGVGESAANHMKVAAGDGESLRVLIRQLRIVTLFLMGALTALLVIYFVLTQQYKDTLLNLNESGVRRFMAVRASTQARSMHAYSLLINRAQGLSEVAVQDMGYQSKSSYMSSLQKSYNGAKSDLIGKMNAYWYIHNNLVNEMKSSYGPQVDFYDKNQPEIKVWYAVDGKKDFKTWMSVSGSDIVWRIIDNARKIAAKPQSAFVNFNKNDPRTFPELYFVLENAMTAARAMDHSTMLYVREASAVAESTRSIFYSLCSLAALIELVMIVIVFRRAVNRLFENKDAFAKKLSTSSSGEVSSDAVQHKLTEMKNRKRTGAAAMGRDQKSSSKATFSNKQELLEGSDTESDSSGDEMEKAKPVKDEKKDKLGDIDELDDSDSEEEDEKASENGSQASQRSRNSVGARAVKDDVRNRGEAGGSDKFVLSLVSYVCLLLVVAALAALGYTCILAITQAESSANELNNGGRRRFLAQKIALHIHELVNNNDPVTSLSGGVIDTQAVPDFTRCLLIRSAESLLSIHTAMLFGTKTGWVDLPEREGWLRGPLDAWGIDGSLDMCSPFTWDREGFLTAAQLPGSFGRRTGASSEENDETYFTNMCLAKLPEFMDASDQLEFTNARVNFFAKSFSAKKCGMFDKKDPVLSMGLHSALVYMVSLSKQIADLHDGVLTRKHAQIQTFVSHDAAEWALGLVRSILLYQREALDGIDTTSTVVIALYLVVGVVVLGQYLFLGRKMTSLMKEHNGLSGIVMRFVGEAAAIDEKIQMERQHLANKTTGKAVNEEEDSEASSASEGASEDFPADEEEE